MLEYVQGAALPAAQLWLLDDVGALINLSSGVSAWEVKIFNSTRTLKTKSTGVVGAAGSGTELDPAGVPNATITWAVGDLSIPAGTHTLQLKATMSSLPRIWQMPILIRRGAA